MSIATPDFAKLKSGMKASWIAGDFGQIATFTAAEGEKFVERIGISPDDGHGRAAAARSAASAGVPPANRASKLAGSCLPLLTAAAAAVTPSPTTSPPAVPKKK